MLLIKWRLIDTIDAHAVDTRVPRGSHAATSMGCFNLLGERQQSLTLVTSVRVPEHSRTLHHKQDPQYPKETASARQKVCSAQRVLCCMQTLMLTAQCLSPAWRPQKPRPSSTSLESYAITSTTRLPPYWNRSSFLAPKKPEDSWSRPQSLVTSSPSPKSHLRYEMKHCSKSSPPTLSRSVTTTRHPSTW